MKLALAFLSAIFLAVSAALVAPAFFGGPSPSGLAFGLAFGSALLAGIAATLFPAGQTRPETPESEPLGRFGEAPGRRLPDAGATGLGGAENGAAGL